MNCQMVDVLKTMTKYTLNVDVFQLDGMSAMIIKNHLHNIEEASMPHVWHYTCECATCALQKHVTKTSLFMDDSINHPWYVGNRSSFIFTASQPVLSLRLEITAGLNGVNRPWYITTAQWEVQPMHYTVPLPIQLDGAWRPQHLDVPAARLLFKKMRKTFTPSKVNMEAKNGALEDNCPFALADF